jgi:hypothetical protein
MSFPSNPTNQQLATVNGITYSYTASTGAWTRVPAQNLTLSGNIVAGGVRSTTSATAPPLPVPGDMWYNTTNDALYRFTSDGVGAYWIDIEGPSIGGVSATATVTFGNVIVGANTAATGANTGALQVTGGAAVAGNLFVSGNLNVLGTQTAYNSVTTTYSTVIANSGAISANTTSGALQIQGGAGITGNTNIGGNLAVAGNVTILGNLSYNYIISQNSVNTTYYNLIANSGVNSTSTTTGALQISGGAGITQNVYVGGNIYAGSLVTTNGITWANGAPWYSSSYSNANVANYLTVYSGVISASNFVTTNGITWANGMPWYSSAYSNTNVAAYLTGSITTGAITTANIITTNGIFWPNGAAYIPPTGVNTRTVLDFVATGGQTTFTGFNYTVGTVDVYHNGVKLATADFTATNGSSVVLGQACVNNDLVEIIINNGYPFLANTSVYRQVTDLVATAGQTSFSALYYPGYIDVFQNGTKLAPSAFVATNGTTVVLGSSASLNDKIEIISYQPVNILSNSLTANIGTLITTTGIFFPNGNPYITSPNNNYANTQAIALLTTYSGNLSAGNITVANAITITNGIYWSNGTAFASSLYSNTNVSAYLSTATISTSGNIVGGGVRTTTATTPPANPVTGDLWYNSTNDVTFRYQYDGINYFWVDITGPALSNATAYGNTVVAQYLPTYSGNLSVGNLTVSGNIVPTANVTYSLGTPTQRFAGLYLSGNTIDLGGATIKTDAATGAIALIPLPTTSNPNPTGVVIGPTGTVSTVATTGGVPSAPAIALSASAASSLGTTLASVTVTGTLTISNGIVWANGAQYSSGGGGGSASAVTYQTYTSGNNTITTNANIITTGNIIGGGVRSTTATTAPTNPVVGDIWYNSNTDITARYTYDGSGYYWIDISSPTVANIATNSNIIVGNITTTGTETVGNLITTNGVFWANGVAYGGSSASAVTYQTYTSSNNTITTNANITTTGNVSSNNITVSSALTLGSWTTNTRPKNATTGTLGFNSNISGIEVYMLGSWYTLLQTNYTITYLIVGGGGAGGWDVGGGGGAGGLLYGNATAVSGTTYSIVVGGGAASSTSGGGQAPSGSNSSATFYPTVAYGGGGGGNYPGGSGVSGGSGGGGSGYASGPLAGGAGTPGQGYSGGAGRSDLYGTAATGGGGGGAGGPGSDSANNIAGSTPGGAGVAYTISGASVTYAAGGKGAGDTYPATSDGAAYTGTGGDGAGGPGDPHGANTGGYGGSGVVIISYQSPAQRGTGGNVGQYQSGSNTTWVHTFNGSGTYIA